MTSAVCNSKQIWNKDKFRCECKKDLINKMICDKGYILDYKNCVCRNSVVDKLVEECANVIDGDTIYNETLTVTSSNDCGSCTPYIVFFTIFFINKYNH